MNLKEIALARLKCMEIELRFNPWHDPKDGKFCSAGGATGSHVLASYKNNNGERVRRVYERLEAGGDIDLKQISNDYEEYKKQQKEALDNGDSRPYNGIKVKRDYNSSVAQTVGKAQYDTLCNDIEHCEDKNVATAYATILSKIDCKLGYWNGGSYSTPNSLKVTIDPNDLTATYRDPGEAIEHETGHVIDWAMSDKSGKRTAIGRAISYQTNGLGKTAKNESKAFVERAKAIYGNNADAVECCEYLGAKHGIQVFKDKASGQATDEFLKLTAGLSDTVKGYTGISLGMGHKLSYYKHGGTKETEIFANVSQLILHGGKAETIYKTEMPETYKAVKDIYANYVKNNMGR